MFQDGRGGRVCFTKDVTTIRWFLMNFLVNESFFLCVFHTQRCGEIRSMFPYSVRMRENTDQKNSEYRQFSCSEFGKSVKQIWRKFQKPLWRSTINCFQNLLSWSYFSVFIPNAGKHGPEKLQIWALFTQWLLPLFSNSGIAFTKKLKKWNEKTNN